MYKSKSIIRLLCISLTAVILFSLTGCFSQPGDSDDYNYNNDEYINNNENANNSANDSDSEKHGNNNAYSTELNYYYEKNAMLPYTQKTEVPEGFIGIYTVDDLLNSDINQNENYILMSDLDLSSIDNWTGITNKAIFDGNDHVISNLKSDCSGLFISAENVSGLKLTDIDISVQINHKESIGGICNTLRGSLSGCYVSGQINCDFLGEDRNESYANIGGHVGKQHDGGSINFCKNDATIFVEAPIGYNVAVGGIAGTVTSINDCINYGEIILETEPSDGLDDSFTLIIEETDTNPYIQDQAGAGGISGQTSYGNITIDACRNEGNVYSNNAAGGILGCAYWDSSDTVTITNCSNTGSILGYGESKKNWVCAVGGIIGTGSLHDENNIIENCFNIGEVGSHKEYYPDYDVTYVGSIIGYEGHLGEKRANFTVKNCTHSTSSSEASGIGAMYSSVTTLSDAEMEDINNYNFTNKNLWKNSPSADSPYPFYTHNHP